MGKNTEPPFVVHGGRPVKPLPTEEPNPFARFGLGGAKVSGGHKGKSILRSQSKRRGKKGR